MTSDEMIEAFGKENLVYARPEAFQNIGIANEMKELILETALPRQISLFRFLMNFEPISEDVKIGESAKNFGQLFTIGYRSATQLLGTLIDFSEIGLDERASLSDLDKKRKKIDEDEMIYALLEFEVNYSYRICINPDKNGEIVCICNRPILSEDLSLSEELSIMFVNSNIQKLAVFLI